MKTAQEILKEAYSIIAENQDSSPEAVDPVLLKSMEEYAEQFKPKWIDTSTLHSVNMKVEPGWYGLLTRDFDNPSIWHQEVKHIKRTIPINVHYYHKINLPEPQKQE